MPHINYGLKGSYKVSIVDSKTGKTVWEQDWMPNLILNNGMERIADDSFVNCFPFAVGGSGTRTNNDASGTTTAACDTSGNVTLAGGVFTFDTGIPGDVGNIIKWNNTGFEGRITSVGTTTTCIVTPTPPIAQSGQFVLYKTNQDGCQTEIQRTNNYLAIAPYSGTTLVGNVYTLSRTWDFPAESGTRVYNEVGVAWNNTLNTPNTTFARVLLPSPATVLVAQQLRLQYRLQMTISPTTPVTKAANISGWPVSPSVNTTGSEQFQYVGLSAVNTSSPGGNFSFDGGGQSNDPSATSNVVIWISPSSAALTTFAATPTSRATNSSIRSVTLVAYTPFSFARIKQITFLAGEANRTDFRSMGIGFNGAGQPTRDTGMTFLFDQSQTKSNANTLNLQWIYSWSRILTPSS